MAGEGGFPGTPQGSKWLQAKLQPLWGLGEAAPALALPDPRSSLGQSPVLSSQMGSTLWVPVCRAQALLYEKAPGSPSGSPRRQAGLQGWNLAVLVHRALALTRGWEGGGGRPGEGGRRGRPVAPIHPPSLPCRGSACCPARFPPSCCVAPTLPGPRGPSRRLSPVWTLCGRKRKERPARAGRAYPSLESSPCLVRNRG